MCGCRRWENMRNAMSENKERNGDVSGAGSESRARAIEMMTLGGCCQIDPHVTSKSNTICPRTFTCFRKQTCYAERRRDMVCNREAVLLLQSQVPISPFLSLCAK